MAGTKYTYTTDLKDYMGGKLGKLATVGSTVYGKLSAGQRFYNKQVAQGNTNTSNLIGNIKRMAGAYIGISAGISLGRNSLSKWDEQMKSDAQLRQSLISTNYAAGKSFEYLANQADKLQAKTLFGDEATQRVQALTLTFKNIRGDIYDRTIPAILDLATSMKIDGKSAAIQLGKALNDPAIGLSMLSRSGITFSKAQTEIIKGFQNTNQLGKAQALILQEIESQFGGSAAAAAKAGLGPWQQFMNKMGDYMERLGPILNNGLMKLIQIAEWVERNAAQIKLWGTVIASFVAGYYAWIGVTKLLTGATMLYRSVQFVVIGLTRGWAVAQRALNLTMMANPLGLVIAAIAALVAGVIYAWNKFEWFRGTILGVWEVMKGFGTMIKDYVINRFWELINGLTGIGKTLMHFFKGEWSEAWETGKKAATDLLGVNSKAKALQQGMGLGKKFREGYNKGVASFAASKTKSKGSMVAGMFADGSAAPVVDGNLLGEKAKQGLTGITSGSSRPTNINISLGKFQENLIIHANNVREGAEEMRDIILEELTRVLNSANQMATQ